MENLLLCSRALYDKDLLDKTREIEELKNKINEMQRNICYHNYSNMGDPYLNRFYYWVDSVCDEDKPHYCVNCRRLMCDHLICDKQETIAECDECNMFSVILNATEKEKSLKICDYCSCFKQKRHALDTTCTCTPRRIPAQPDYDSDSDSDSSDGTIYEPK